MSLKGNITSSLMPHKLRLGSRFRRERVDNGKATYAIRYRTVAPNLFGARTPFCSTQPTQEPAKLLQVRTAMRDNYSVITIILYVLYCIIMSHITHRGCSIPLLIIEVKMSFRYRSEQFLDFANLPKYYKKITMQFQKIRWCKNGIRI